MKKCVIVVAVALMDDNNQILLAQRPMGKHMGGMWEFPGGKIEDFETPENALIRELYEELDVHTLPQDLQPLTFASHDYEDFHLLMPLYLCKKWSGELKPKEGQTLVFAPLNALLSYQMPPADIPLVHRILDFFSSIL
jgi:8-oxo-dGTP diphosphatase